MASPAPREPLAQAESVRAVLAELDADPKLGGKGLSEAFARSFPELPAEAKALITSLASIILFLSLRQLRRQLRQRREQIREQFEAVTRGDQSAVEQYPGGLGGVPAGIAGIERSAE